MIPHTPPASLQQLVLALLPPRDQETVVGDLLEVYAERRQQGALAANLWYLRQAVSLLPRSASRAYVSAPALVLLCCFTAACAIWLGTMSILTRHGNVLYQESIVALILGQALLTLVMLPLRRIRSLRWAVSLGAVAIAWLGGSALVAMGRGDHSFEGYILLIALLLIVQAGLTWSDLLRSRSASA